MFYFFLGKTELAKQLAKYLHKDISKVSRGNISSTININHEL